MGLSIFHGYFSKYLNIEWFFSNLIKYSMYEEDLNNSIKALADNEKKMKMKNQNNRNRGF